MTLTRQQKKILIEVHPDRHGGDTSRLEQFFAAMKRPSQSKFVRRVCCVCGVRIGGVKTCRTHMRIPLALSSLILTVGCAVTKPIMPKPQFAALRTIPRVTTTISTTAEAVTIPQLRGCAWDAPVNYNPQTEYFEVWSTTDLSQPFSLRTNTQQTVALFPEQQAEFYMVRTANTNGLKSDWATTGH